MIKKITPDKQNQGVNECQSVMIISYIEMFPPHTNTTIILKEENTKISFNEEVLQKRHTISIPLCAFSKKTFF